MTKKEAKKVPQRRTELDRIVTQLRTLLRRDTTSIIEKGKLLLQSRELLANEHGDWQDWLAKNFDLSLRTAQNYCAAAEYVARKSATVADFANLSPSVLYWLAGGDYNEQEEAAILAATHAGRVDQEAAVAICEKLAPADDDDADDADDGDEDSDEDSGDEGGGEDADTSAILDGPPPAVPPPAPPRRRPTLPCATSI
jgi:hypothetical protein